MKIISLMLLQDCCGQVITVTVSDTGTDNNVIKRDKIFIKLQQTVMRQVGLICVKEEGRPLDKGHTAYTAFIIYSFLLTTLFTCI